MKAGAKVLALIAVVMVIINGILTTIDTLTITFGKKIDDLAKKLFITTNFQESLSEKVLEVTTDVRKIVADIPAQVLAVPGAIGFATNLQRAGQDISEEQIRAVRSAIADENRRESVANSRAFSEKTSDAIDAFTGIASKALGG